MKSLLDTIKETKEEHLNETTTMFSRVEQLVRMGLMPVSQLHHLKRAMTQMESGGFMPTLERKAFYQFVNGLMEVSLADPSLHRLIKNRVSMKAGMKEEVEVVEEEKESDKPYVGKTRRALLGISKEEAKKMRSADAEKDERLKELRGKPVAVKKSSHIRFTTEETQPLDEGNKDKRNEYEVRTGTAIRKMMGHTKPDGSVEPDYAKQGIRAERRLATRTERHTQDSTRIARTRLAKLMKVDPTVKGAAKEAWKDRIKTPKAPLPESHMLDEALNFRGASDAALQAMANTVFRKKRAGGQVTDADRQLASRAKAELRRRRNLKEDYNVSLSKGLEHFGYTSVVDVPEEKVTEFFAYIDSLDGEQ
jgi:hypothetical protein